MDERRNQRVSIALKEEITELIAFELSDPRLDGVSVTDVHLSPDLRLASIRLAIPGDRTAQESALNAIHGAKSFIKRELAQRIDLFRMPELRFEADLSPETGARVKQLLRRVRKGRPRDAELQENSAESSKNG